MFRSPKHGLEKKQGRQAIASLLRIEDALWGLDGRTVQNRTKQDVRTQVGVETQDFFSFFLVLFLLWKPEKQILWEQECGIWKTLSFLFYTKHGMSLQARGKEGTRRPPTPFLPSVHALHDDLSPTIDVCASLFLESRGFPPLFFPTQNHVHDLGKKKANKQQGIGN